MMFTTTSLQRTPRLLAIDIGGGTQDILLWDPATTVENAVKLVVPSPTRIVARRIAAQTRAGRDIFLTGRLMGGGAVTRAVRQHLQAGLKVFAQPGPAQTLHDNPAKLTAWGIQLVDVQPPKTTAVVLGDIDLPALQRALAEFEIELPSSFAVAVQDHGFSPKASNRRHRFQHWERFLAQGGELRHLAYRQPPADLTRMAAVQEVLPGALVMDTCAAGVWGALLDPQVQQHAASGLVVVNCGNEHTFAVLVREGVVWGIYEHHTGLLSPAKLADHLRRFQAGQLTNQEIYDDMGHGCCLRPGSPANGQPFATLVLTGPQRRLGADLPAIQAAPFGDMMLTGCFGLVAAAGEVPGS
ncbi:MAG: DUF1786 domain-containing protein [Desulfobacca sp.]|uniref:DUF1786 domain-containing protein n=1 Tax=Desulfobacca sp. TaxID=2067990 RepID=UPI00404960FD